MRSDMAKIIVERPRIGSRMRGKGKGYQRSQQRFDRDEQPKREAIKRLHWSHSKSLNENLAPLRRFLFKQAGRVWNSVFAEICEHISRDSAVQDHVRDHVNDFVAVRVFVVDGELHEIRHWGGLAPLACYPGRPRLYVCPESGVLKRVKKVVRFRIVEPPMIHIRHEFGVSFIRKGKVWYHVEMGPFLKKNRNPLFPDTARDVLTEADITRDRAVEIYGRAELPRKVRRATPYEIRKVCEPLKAPNRV